MAEIVNLRRARKAKAKTDAETQAAENRIRFGRTKTERERVAAVDALATRRLEEHRREPLRDEDPLDPP
jgi:hypothetical protein